ncbi:hypothetical protein OROMI_002628 [Orobanche minor]
MYDGKNPRINDVLEAPTSDYSSDSGEERKTKRLFVLHKLQIEKGITYYRSNLRTATSSIHELTFSASHLKALRRIPSWYMFEEIQKHGGERMMSRDKSEDVIRNILLSYDQESDHFILGALMHCYLMASVLTPWQSSSVSWYFIDYLEDLEGAMTYDWCGYIAAILRNGIRNTRNLKIGGCAMLLPYWLCEHTSLVEPSSKVTKDLLNPTAEEKKIRELIGVCGIGSNEHRISQEDVECETDCEKVETTAAVCSTDQDISDGGENIHLTAELGADSNETHLKPGAMSFDAVHGDLSSSSSTPFKAFGGNVVEGDIVQPRSLKNGRSVIREDAIREDEVIESAFGETLIPEMAECEKADVATGGKDKEPIISICPLFSLDITQLRTPKKDQPSNETEVIVSDSNLRKADPAIDEVDVIIDEWCNTPNLLWDITRRRPSPRGFTRLVTRIKCHNNLLKG